jgi:hypothetical protein
MQFYDYEKLNTIAYFFNCFLHNFYFVYLFRAALCDFFSELSSVPLLKPQEAKVSAKYDKLVTIAKASLILRIDLQNRQTLQLN